MDRSNRPQVPLPWERLLWSGRSAWRGRRRARYALTDFRVVRIDGDVVRELALHDIADVQRRQARVDRLLGVSTLVIQSTQPGETLTIESVARGPQLAAVLDLISGDPGAALDRDAIAAALAWDPPAARSRVREAAAAAAVVLAAVFGLVIGLHGKSAAPVYAADDPIYPNGQKRSRAEIVRFMQRDVMPWARAALAPIKGGTDRITCETCHGAHPEQRDWRMPAVAALPEPDIRQSGWENWGGTMDAQIRNAIYGYRAESEKQTRAGYMREVVMPGMAGLLGRPPYDFTRPYDYNRSHLAFGCYHCHLVR
jgi:hypothetical protein